MGVQGRNNKVNSFIVTIYFPIRPFKIKCMFDFQNFSESYARERKKYTNRIILERIKTRNRKEIQRKGQISFCVSFSQNEGKLYARAGRQTYN